MASGGAALVCFSHRALAGLPSLLLEINYHARFCKSVDLLEDKRPRLWPIYGRTLNVSFIVWSQQTELSLGYAPPLSLR